MKKALIIIFIMLIAFMLFYFGLPVINYGFVKLPLLLLLLFGILFLFFFKFKVDSKTHKTTVLSMPHKGLLYVMLVLFFYVTIVPLITSFKMFRSDSYKQLLGKVNKGEKITQHIAPIAIDKIRVVDEELAYLLGEKILGSQPALGSQVELGDFCIQKVQNELYWVAPLLHSGFFKWSKNFEGTTGYVMVSATNERDVKLVQNIGGKPLKIKFQPSAYFNSEIHRHAYLNGYMSIGLTDFTFEIDDEGNPFWVITKYDKTIGFSGNNATGVLVVNAQNGVIQDYSIPNTPLWVDRIQPIDFIEDQLDDWGTLIHGYFNFSNEDKLQITEGMTLVYGKDNKSYWYTGITSTGKDESSVGFVLVDTRTKETTFYKQGGATEFAAQSSAQGKVQEKEYIASMPIPYNINAIPTYVMTLKDKGGLVKMFAMVAISDYTIVGVGNTLRETLTSYKNVYNMADNKINPNATSNKKIIESVVTRIQNDVKNGNSFYYFTLQKSPTIYVGSSQISNELPVTVVGDSIKISYDLDLEKVVDISSFRNLTLSKK
jgi:hypothetical protein